MSAYLALITAVSTPVLFMVAYRIGPIRALRTIQDLAETPDPIRERAWEDYAAHLARKSNPYN